MRLYNGCPDSALRAVWDEQDRVHKELADLGVRVSYFPVEGKYMGFSGGGYYSHDPRDTEFHDTGLPLREASGFHSTLHGVLHEVRSKAAA